MNTRKRLWILLGIVVLATGRNLPTNPVVMQVPDGSTYAAPQQVGLIIVNDGTEFEFYSTVGGFDAVVRFQVPANGTYNFHYRGRDLFDLVIRSTQMGPALVTLKHDTTRTGSLSAGTDYYLEIEQTGGAMLGGSFAAIWAD